jgi:hypothetical protein
VLQWQKQHCQTEGVLWTEALKHINKKFRIRRNWSFLFLRKAWAGCWFFGEEQDFRPGILGFPNGTLKRKLIDTDFFPMGNHADQVFHGCWRTLFNFSGLWTNGRFLTNQLLDANID